MIDKHLVKMDFPKLEEELKQPQFVSELFGMIQTVTTAPSGNPTKLIDQIKIFNDSGTRKLRIYDTSNGTWYGVTLS